MKYLSILYFTQILSFYKRLNNYKNVINESRKIYVLKPKIVTF